MKRLKRHSVLIFAIAAYLLVLSINNGLFLQALEMTWMFIKEMIMVLPPVLILSGLITVWIPKETIIRFLGNSSGIRGKIISIIIGSISAGPIYAAFPVCKTLLKKGASIFNIVIIISSWAVIKIPILFVEASFLGIKFAFTRYILTIPFIFLLGFLLDMVVKSDELLTSSISDSIIEKLPGINCKACGFESCFDFSKAVDKGEVVIGDCKCLKSRK